MQWLSVFFSLCLFLCFFFVKNLGAVPRVGRLSYDMFATSQRKVINTCCPLRGRDVFNSIAYLQTFRFSSLLTVFLYLNVCLYFVKQSQRRVFGDFCQCDNFNCPMDDRGRICGGEVMIRRVSRFGVQSNLVKTNFKGQTKMVRLNKSSSYCNLGNFVSD